MARRVGELYPDAIARLEHEQSATQERINKAVQQLDTAIVRAEDLSLQDFLRKVQSDLRGRG
jgi:hypothetical protein